MKKLLFIAIIPLVLGSCNKNNQEIKLIPIKSGDKWGYIDKTGNLKITAQFDEAHLFRDGLALIKTKEDKYGYIDENGNFLIKANYKAANSFSEELACVVMENGKPQYINTKGEVVFTTDADLCGGFSEGMAPVKIKGKWGYIDKTGKIIINAEYENANKFSEGLAAVAKIIGNKKEKKWGFIDKEGNVKIDFQFIEDTTNFSSPSYFSEGIAFVSNDGKKWGCINHDGKYVINPQYDGGLNLDGEFESTTYEFKNGLAAIKMGDYWGYIDKKGKYAINPQFLSAQDFTSNDIAAVQGSDKRYGFIDKNGKYLINPQFDNVKLGYKNDFAIVETSGKFGIINAKGTYEVNPQYDGVWICTSCWVAQKRTDFIDYDLLAKNFFENSSEEKIRNISVNTTLKNITDQYPKVKREDMEMFAVNIKDPKLTINDMFDLVNIQYYFSDGVYTNVPVYKDAQRYNYWTGGYMTVKDVDHYEKKYNDDVKVSAVVINGGLLANGAERSFKFSEALEKYAVKFLKMELKDHPETGNNKESGLLVLRNEYLLLQIRYSSLKGDDKKTISPLFKIIVINKNYKTTFDILEKQLVSSYIEDKKEEDRKAEENSKNTKP
jgi:hypothetical protein